MIGYEASHLQAYQNAVWRAGAGAGKTFNLVQRIAALIEQHPKGLEPLRIVVTTFTRMATSELKERIRQEAINRFIAGDASLVPYANRAGLLRVTTLHSIAERFLRQYGQPLGIEPSFQVSSDQQLRVQQRQWVRQWFLPIAQGESSQGKELLQQLGFRKTAQYVVQVQNALEVNPGLRFATAEDFQRLEWAQLGERARWLNSSLQDVSDDWPDFCAEMGSALSRAEKCQTALDWQDLGRTLDAIKVPAKKRGVPLTEGQDQFKSKTTKVLKAFIDRLNELESYKEEWALLERLNQDLQFLCDRTGEALGRQQIRSGQIPLGRVEALALRLCREHPEVAQQFAEQTNFWLIDEYQDTSPLQVELLKHWTEGALQFVVGDPQQSIYLFRGARPFVFLEKVEAAAAHGSQLVELSTNRRSHPEVLRGINAIVEQLGEGFQAMHAHRESTETGSGPWGRCVFLSCIKSDGEESQSASQRRDFEAQTVAGAISTLLESGVRADEVAVLGRSNRDISLVARELGRWSIPFQLFSSGKFSERVEVQDLCALLLFMSNPYDDENLIRVARAEWLPLSNEVLERSIGRDRSIWEVISNGEECKALHQALREAKAFGFVLAVQRLLDRCGYWSVCQALDPSGRREANSYKWIAMLTRAERANGFSVRRFVSEVLSDDGESSETDAVSAWSGRRVRLMTVHASKGLEFPHVVVPFLGERPQSERKASGFVLHESEKIWTIGNTDTFSVGEDWKLKLQSWTQEESKRLLYVALSRAKEGLLLSGGEPMPDSFLSLFDPIRAGFRKIDPSEIAQHAPVKDFKPLAYCDYRQVQSSESDQAYERTEPHCGQKEPQAPLDPQTRQEPKTIAPLLLKADRGTRLHYIFEVAARSLRALSELREQEVGLDQLPELESVMSLWTDRERQEAQDALKFIFSTSDVADYPNLPQILESGVAEWAYLETAKTGEITRRVIDLWGRDEFGRLWIVDYKTGSSDFVESAFSQMREYARALSRSEFVQSDEPIFLAAVFPIEKKIFTRRFE